MAALEPHSRKVRFADDGKSPVSEVLLTDDAAHYIASNRRTMEYWRLTGYGPPFVQLGRRVGYRREALNQWLARQEARNTTEARTRRPKRKKK